jgi:hypothetical protein
VADVAGVLLDQVKPGTQSGGYCPASGGWA